MRISDWSSDVCSSDLEGLEVATANSQQRNLRGLHDAEVRRSFGQLDICPLWRIGSACSFKKSAYTSRWPLPLVEASRAVLSAKTFATQSKIGRAHVGTPVTNAQLVCRLLLAKNNIN